MALDRHGPHSHHGEDVAWTNLGGIYPPKGNTELHIVPMLRWGLPGASFHGRFRAHQELRWASMVYKCRTVDVTVPLVVGTFEKGPSIFWKLPT